MHFVNTLFEDTKKAKPAKNRSYFMFYESKMNFF